MSGAVGVNRSDAALWPRLGPALSLNWVSRLPLSPNIPLGAPGNIPWFAADCPAPRSLRCGQSGRRPGGRGLGRQRPGTLRCIVAAQEVVGGADHQRKAADSHLADKELHLCAVLQGSMGCSAACLHLCLPPLLSLCPSCCKQVLKSQGRPPSSSPMPGSILPQGLGKLGPPPTRCPPPLGFCFVAVHFFLITSAPILTLLGALWI